MLHVRQRLFHEFLFVFFLLPDTDIIMTLLCDILFIALLSPFNNEDKRLAHH